MNRSPIEWTQYTSNPIRAHSGPATGHYCEKISDGCKLCYASRLQKRFGMPTFDEAQHEHVPVYLDENELQHLLKRRKPATVFLGDMTDIFGDWVPFEWLDKIFAVAALNQNLTLQILTKRAERMREYFSEPIYRQKSVLRAAWDFDSESDRTVVWPLPNVHLGVSVENPDSLWRLGHLKETPAAVRFASFEPLLADLGDISEYLKWLNWAIFGGESGKGARPCDIAWIRSGVQQCVAAGVQPFVKQLGSFPVYEKEVGTAKGGCHVPLELKHSKGGDPLEWPEDLRVREMPR